jgi:FAD/FMN-containing dehydrogenase
MNSEGIGTLTQKLRGALIGRDHVDYDEARKLYNGMIDKRPLLIARCVDAADVIAAVNFGRDNKLQIAMRGGGHNGAGFASIDDGLVIDLSLMRGVRVDPANRTVREGEGAQLVMSTMPPMPLGWPSPSGLSRLQALLA